MFRQFLMPFRLSEPYEGFVVLRVLETSAGTRGSCTIARYGAVVYHEVRKGLFINQPSLIQILVLMEELVSQ